MERKLKTLSLKVDTWKFTNLVTFQPENLQHILRMLFSIIHISHSLIPYRLDITKILYHLFTEW